MVGVLCCRRHGVSKPRFYWANRSETILNDVFDVAIIGGGVCGAAIARRLSACELKVALLEKCSDVSFGVNLNC